MANTEESEHKLSVFYAYVLFKNYPHQLVMYFEWNQQSLEFLKIIKML